MRGKILRITAVAALCLVPAVSFAAGNAHVVDDAAVEKPGACHVEAWGTRFNAHSDFIDVSPGCTFTKLPDLEIGASFQHTHVASQRGTTLGPDLKYMLRDPTKGFGVAVEGSVYFDTARGDVKSTTVRVPVTVAPNDRLELNLNVGWIYARASKVRHDAFYGAQITYMVTQTVMLMAERFGTSRGKPGDQFGLRWSPGAGRIDIDLLYGQRIDGQNSHAVTLGLTVRP